MILSENMQIILYQDHTSDLEVPHQHHQVNVTGEEQWIVSYGFDFSLKNSILVKFLHFTDPTSQDYSASVWQPPRFV